LIYQFLKNIATEIKKYKTEHKQQANTKTNLIVIGCFLTSCDVKLMLSQVVATVLPKVDDP
jgi:hypothetical protein